MALCVYYLDEPLRGDDEDFVRSELAPGDILNQRRIPHVLPVLQSGKLTQDQYIKHTRLLRRALRSVGIGENRTQQIVLVAPVALYWYSVLMQAVAEETGIHPYLVQTAEQRDQVGNPGSTRFSMVKD